jgi:hypothetical protein
MFFEKYCKDPNIKHENVHQRNYEDTKYGIIGSRGSNSSIWSPHISAIQVQQRIKEWDEYFKFCTVRNPWDQAVSNYYFFYKSRLPAEESSSFKWSSTPGKTLRETCWSLPHFKQFLKSKLCRNWEKICTKKNQPGLDFYIRYENLVIDPKDQITTTKNIENITTKRLKI